MKQSDIDADIDAETGPAKRGTVTSAFGAGKRESHDASGFYARFTPPIISDDENVVAPAERPVTDEILHGDAATLLADDTHVRDNSIALVVTSPPYFVGKSYEEAMGQGHIPAEYEDHLANLHRIFQLSAQKLEPGGRIAVNVANLGRKPYRSQAADIIRIFEDLGLLVRGEIIWKKGEGSNGSTAWGSFQKPSNPVLRDLTERVIVASKGRFDRAIPSRQRAEQGLPSEGSITKEAFMRDTKDVWEILPESAKRVGHPAPFPVALPGRLIELFTYRGDMVLDPYMGAGTTAIAAIRTERHFIGCETDHDYIVGANQRIANERERLELTKQRREKFRVVVPAVKGGDPADPDDDFQARAVRQGQKAEEIAAGLLERCGFTDIVKNRKLRCGVEVDFEATDGQGQRWHFDVTGAFTSERAGLRRTDSVWKSLGKAGVRQYDDAVKESGIPYVLLTTALPTTGVGLKALRTAHNNGLIFDALEMFADAAQQRLADFGAGSVDCKDLADEQPEFLDAEETDALF